jgi:hypothetical protein
MFYPLRECINIHPRQPIDQASSLCSAESEQMSYRTISATDKAGDLLAAFIENDQAEVVVAMMIGHEGRFGQERAQSGTWSQIGRCASSGEP